MEFKNCGWAGYVKDFISKPNEEIVSSLSSFLREEKSEQIFPWDRSISALKENLVDLKEIYDCALIFEYDYPRSGGKRPDLIFLNNGTVLVIEFKNRVEPETADFDQVLGYVRDLTEYHPIARDKKLIPILIPIGFDRPYYESKGVYVLKPKDLPLFIQNNIKKSDNLSDIKRWTESSCEPLPSLIESAKLIFHRKPLPNIKQAESAKIPEILNKIEKIIQKSTNDKTKKLILITGVPGAGKTLVGLQIVHNKNISVPSIFLSGNGPLVQVLQYELESKVMVSQMKSFLQDLWIKHKDKPVREKVIVFDEAQRAWDRDRILEKHWGKLADSEPGLLLGLSNRVKDSLVVIALIGEGQEIHAGEESGIKNWVDAVRKNPIWEVIGPKHLSNHFLNNSIKYEIEELFHLTNSIRNIRAIDTSKWVNFILDGDINEASILAEKIKKDGYHLRISRDIEISKNYINDFMKDRNIKRSGILVSSKFRKSEYYGVKPVRNQYYYYGEWYSENNKNNHSGSNLKEAVSEFGCQGLELDLPLLCWGTDFFWSNNKWNVKVGKPRKVKDPNNLRINAYRVLMTRGREGLLVFVPKISDLDDTYNILLKVGFENI